MVGDAALLNYLKGLLWARFSVYDLSVIPLFLLMGQFASAAGFSRDLFQVASALMGASQRRRRDGGDAGLRRVRRDLRLVGGDRRDHVAGGAAGDEAAATIPDRLATGTLAAGGTLGILIPPSVILIIYAILAEQNIAKLFAAAMIPGIIAASAT